MRPDPQTPTTNHYGGLRLRVNTIATSHKYLLQWDITTLIPISTSMTSRWYKGLKCRVQRSGLDISVYQLLLLTRCQQNCFSYRGFNMLTEWNRTQYKEIRHISDPCTLTIRNFFQPLFFIISSPTI